MQPTFRKLASRTTLWRTADGGWAAEVSLSRHFSLIVERTVGSLEISLQWVHRLPTADRWPLLDLARISLGPNPDQRQLLHELRTEQ